MESLWKSFAMESVYIRVSIDCIAAQFTLISKINIRLLGAGKCFSCEGLGSGPWHGRIYSVS